MYIHIQGSSRLNKSPKFAQIQKDPKPYLMYYCFYNECYTIRIEKWKKRSDENQTLLLKNVCKGFKIWCWSSWENGHNLKTNSNQLTENRRQTYLFLNLKVSLGTFLILWSQNDFCLFIKDFRLNIFSTYEFDFT